MDILQEEVNLQRIAKLVGPDALPEQQRLTLMIAEIVKNAFLQQNSFDDIDMYCSPEKQLWMLRMLVSFSKKARAIVRAGGSIADIREIPELDRLNRMKSEIANDDAAAMAGLEQSLLREMESLERKLR